MAQVLKVAAGGVHQTVIKAGQGGIKWLGLEVLRLGKGQEWQGDLADDEAAFVVMGGKVSIAVIGKSSGEYKGIGGRPDIFGGAPATVYAPRRSKVTVKADSDAEVAIAKAPCTVDLPAAHIPPENVRVVSSGMANWRRDVRMVIPPGSPVSQRLIIGETLNPPGNWSGIPAHKHDQIVKGENFLEEFYFFRARPADGFGVQVMYDQKKAEAVTVGNDDVTVMLNGYHPTVAAPGVTLCYLWVLSGDSKAYDIVIDPRFGWVPTAESVMREMARA
jgi:5-deoxy-glucuronate isomerase